MTKPKKVFLSYSWDNDGHRKWVHDLAARLREDDGIETILDQWHVVPGDQITHFMERAIRMSAYVIIVCTPRYKKRSDTRRGGVGYEGDVMTAEVLTKKNDRKFIPLIVQGNHKTSIPSWLKGKACIDFKMGQPGDMPYRDLVATILGTRPGPPEIRTGQPSDCHPPTQELSPIWIGVDPIAAWSELSALAVHGVANIHVRAALIGRVIEGNIHDRQCALTALGVGIKYPDARAAIIGRLADKSPEVRSVATEIVNANLVDPDVRKALIQIFEHPKKILVKTTAYFANALQQKLATLLFLAGMYNPDVQNSLLLIATGSGPLRLRTLTVEILHNHYPSTRKLLLQLLDTEEESLRLAAETGLSRALGYNDVRTSLTARLLHHADAGVRIATVRLLARRRASLMLGEGAEEEIRETLRIASFQDNDPDVRFAAGQAIEQRLK